MVAGPPKLGIALGGGGVLGIAHIGFLSALEQAGVSADIVTGTSVGSLVGACYAAGMSASEIAEVARHMSWRRIRRRIVPRLALFSNNRLGEFLTATLPTHDFSELPLPFAAVATDLATGEMVILHGAATSLKCPTGQRCVAIQVHSVPDAVRASCAIPIIFEPVEIDGRLLIDGGLTNNVPAGVARMLGADVVVGVDVAKRKPRCRQPENIIEYMDQVTDIYLSWMIRQRNIFADVVVRPSLAAFSHDQFESIDEIIAAGEQAAARAIGPIREAIRRTASSTTLEVHLGRP